jgi:hypothetical protein
MTMRHIAAIAFVAHCILSGCSSEEPLPCSFHGATGSCSQAANKVLGSSGLCSYDKSSQSLASECVEYHAGYQDCWIACVERASTCAQADDCDPACKGCD